MNVRKLRQLQRWILAEPRRFDMKDWSGKSEIHEQQKPPCGTVGCLGGMACHMEGYSLALGENSLLQDKGYIPAVAASILGLTQEEADRLFYVRNIHTDQDLGWPKKFENQYARAKTPLAKVKVAVRRIDHFIKTKGAE